MSIELMNAFKDATREVRRRLADADIGGSFEFTIQASGRIQDGDVKIIIGLGPYNMEVKGNSVKPVVDEFLRRRGWTELHDGCLLEAPSSHSSDEQDLQQF